jgi:CRISPR-associated protein Cmr4
MRNKTTKHPVVPGSTIKGVLRDHYRENEQVNAAFGSDGDTTAKAGALVFTDAKLFCMPIRSLYGVFAWVTCPTILNTLERDTDLRFESPEPNAATVASTANTILASNEKIYLEDLDLTVEKSVNELAIQLSKQIFPDETWQQIFQQRFAVVSDDVFTFLSETGTQVNARTSINPETGTVKGTALWYEEALPCESILTGLAISNKKEMRDQFTEDKTELRLQMGGNSTTGCGQVRLRFADTDLAGGES